jgi:hypothetical protein
MTIGSGSDNAVMVGTTISNPVSNNVQGISFRGAYGEVQISSEGSSGAPLYLNRKSSDGVIEVFRKDGNDVGSIGVSSDGASFGNATQHVAMHSGKLFPASPTHSTLDNTIDLGYSAGRYKDLYLSGGVYLGGTGSANKLEDYEEGGGIPSVGATTSGTISYPNTATSKYVKIGSLVTFNFEFQVTATGTGAIRVSLPFTPNAYAAGSLRVYNVSFSGTSPFLEVVPNDARAIFFSNTNNSATSSIMSTGFYYGAITYTTDS